MEVAVVHLVWQPLGLDPFVRFLQSYRAHPAGMPHALVLLFNGFEREDETAPYRSVCDVPSGAHFLAGRRTDIAAYYAAAHGLTFDALCFLNSHVEVLRDGWLASLAEHLGRDGVGVVAPTGSYESRFTERWRAAVDDTRRLMQGPERSSQMLSLVRNGVRAGQCALTYPPFPNPHVRTGAFMVRRADLLGVKPGSLASKGDTYRFESGRRGMTRELARRGLGAVVVGADGKGYQVPEWPHSRTFRCGDQENLLIADNRTRQYEEAGGDERFVLARAAWGAACPDVR